MDLRCFNPSIYTCLAVIVLRECLSKYDETGKNPQSPPLYHSDYPTSFSSSECCAYSAASGRMEEVRRRYRAIKHL
ncbi:hypothetical protein BR93DRAFT_923345, partial [Coniochaeta sp. PMI_546]